MPAAYMLADVVVSASTDPEGFGRVIVEAQAMGRPVVATDHGGARETIVPGVTGWLVPPRDPAALAAAIGEALSLGAGERDALARRASAHVAAHFTREAMCARTIDVYEELLFQEQTEIGAPCNPLVAYGPIPQGFRNESKRRSRRFLKQADFLRDMISHALRFG